MDAFIQHRKVFGGLRRGKRVFHVHRGGPNPDFAKYFRAPQSKSVDKWHCFEILMMSAKYLVQGFNFQCQGPEIFTRLVSETTVNRIRNKTGDGHTL